MTALDALSSENCGILLSLLVMRAEEAVLARLASVRREACTRAWQALRELDEEARTKVLTQWRRSGEQGAPLGLERLHPSWIEASLVGEPSHVLRALLAGPELPESVRQVALACLHGGANSAQPSEASPGYHAEAARPAIAREVRRAAFAWLAPLLESRCGPVAEALCALSGDGLLDETRRQGAWALGRFLAGEAPALRARVMAALGEPWASVISASAAEVPSFVDQTLSATLATTSTSFGGPSPRERLLAIGLAVLKTKLLTEGPGSPLRVAGRLPISLGLTMTGELEKHRHGLLVTGATRPGANLG